MEEFILASKGGRIWMITMSLSTPMRFKLYWLPNYVFINKILMVPTHVFTSSVIAIAYSSQCCPK
jgi:hypothetical protein